MFEVNKQIDMYMCMCLGGLEMYLFQVLILVLRHLMLIWVAPAGFRILASDYDS